VAFSIVAGLIIVAKLGHNQLCVYMALLIRTRAAQHKPQRSAKNRCWIAAPHSLNSEHVTAAFCDFGEISLGFFFSTQHF